MFYQLARSYRCIAMLTKRPLTSLTTIMLVIWGIIFLHLATDRTITEDASQHINNRRQKHHRANIKHGLQTKKESRSLENFVRDGALFMEDGMVLDMSSVVRRRKEMFRKFDKIHREEKLKSLRKEKLAKLDKLHESDHKNEEIASINNDYSTDKMTETNENSGLEVIRNRDQLKAERDNYLTNLANQTRDMQSQIVDVPADGNRRRRKQLIGEIQQAPGKILYENYVDDNVSGGRNMDQVRDSSQSKHEQEERKENSKEASKGGTSRSKDTGGREKRGREEINTDEGPRKDNQKARINKDTLNGDMDAKHIKDDVNKNGSKNEGNNQNENKLVGDDGGNLKARESKENNDIDEGNVGKTIGNPKNTNVEKREDSNKEDSNSKNWTLEDESLQIQHEANDSYNRDGKEGTVDNKERKDSNKSKDDSDSKEKTGRKEMMENKQRKGNRDRKNIKIEYEDKKATQRPNDDLGNILKRNSIIMSNHGTELRDKESIEGNKNRIKKDSKHNIWRNKFNQEKNRRQIQRTNKNNLLMKGIINRNAEKNYNQEQFNDSRINNKRSDSGLKEHRRRENFYGMAANAEDRKDRKDKTDRKDRKDSKDSKG